MVCIIYIKMLRGNLFFFEISLLVSRLSFLPPNLNFILIFSEQVLNISVL